MNFESSLLKELSLDSLKTYKEICSGSMFHTNFTVYAMNTTIYIVYVTGHGTLDFNLRDFPCETCTHDKEFLVIANGDFDEVGKCAFADWISLKSVVLPPTIQRIGYRAFSDCDNLDSIIMPGHIQHIGEGAFDYTKPKAIYLYDDLPLNDYLIDFFLKRDITLMYNGLSVALHRP